MARVEVARQTLLLEWERLGYADGWKDGWEAAWREVQVGQAACSDKEMSEEDAVLEIHEVWAQRFAARAERQRQSVSSPARRREQMAVSLEDALGTRQNESRRKELQARYGAEGSLAVLEAEAALDASFDQMRVECQPKHWPVLPLRAGRSERSFRPHHAPEHPL